MRRATQTGRRVLLTMLLAALPGSASADNAPVEGWTTTLRPAYLQVPGYQTYKNVKLHLQVRLPDAPAQGVERRVELRLDGRALAQSTLKPDLTFTLPDLQPNGHVLRLRTLGTVLPGECAALGQELTVTGAELQYQPQQTGYLRLSRLPEGLYQPRLDLLTVGQIGAEKWNSHTMQAALQLAQLFSQDRPVVWQSNLHPALPADFSVDLLRRPGLGVPVRLELLPGRLKVLYRKESDLPAAVATLASPESLSGLQGPRADLEDAPKLAPASAESPRTLADLGLGDYRVWPERAEAEQALKLPPLWEPGGPVSGELHYFLPPPVRGTEQVRLRLGNRTTTLEGRSEPGNGLWARFQGNAPGPGEGLAFAVSSSRLSRCDNSVRVANDSVIDVHPRTRSGLAALPSLLLYSPVIQLPHTPGDIDLALNVAASLHRWGLRGLLPWEVHFAPPPRPATLLLGHAPQVAGRGELRLRSSLLVKPQVSLLTASTQDAQALGPYWQRIPDQLTDHLNSAQILPGGELSPQQAANAAPGRATLLALGFSLLALPVLGIVWWLRRRNT